MCFCKTRPLPSPTDAPEVQYLPSKHSILQNGVENLCCSPIEKI
jgi:hypothetical protein